MTPSPLRPPRVRRAYLAVLAVVLLAGCKPTLAEPATEQRVVVNRPSDAVTFAVIGDFGRAGEGEAAVAKLVMGWDPELVLTLGDNNYPDGAEATIDENIGQYYHHFIAPYRGKYGAGAETNRFFPTLGNHDWRQWNLSSHLEYFTLPGNERYYDLRWGPVHFFALDSDPNEPDGNESTSAQAKWLREGLARSQAPFAVVFMHHPPFSSGRHGSNPDLQWPFHQWGADVVLSGHDHHYERIERPEGTYVVNGLGGYKIYEVANVVEGSKKRFNERFGAMRGHATADELTLEFLDVAGTTVDRFVIRARPEG